ncbi:MAG: hypothetical protein IPJ47_22960 [Anaerolineales bacterium]|nr:hypothetical protein [Anaerolineales bacterium]
MAHTRQAISNAVFIIVINLFFGLAPHIDTWGHIGGLLGGRSLPGLPVPNGCRLGSRLEFSS